MWLRSWRLLWIRSNMPQRTSGWSLKAPFKSLFCFIIAFFAITLLFHVISLTFNHIVSSYSSSYQHDNVSLSDLHRVLCIFWIDAATSSPSQTQTSPKKSLELEHAVRNYSPILRKQQFSKVLGLGLRMLIPHSFSGSSRATAMSTRRCAMRRSRKWPALSITARTPSTSSRGRSSSTTTWTRRL